MHTTDARPTTAQASTAQASTAQPATADPANCTTGRRALIEVTPELAERFRDPRVVLGAALAVAGGIAILAGYWGVSGTLEPGKQLPYIISGGIGGLFLLALGAALAFSSDLARNRTQVGELRDVVLGLSAQLDELRDELAAARDEAAEPQPARARAPRRR